MSFKFSCIVYLMAILTPYQMVGEPKLTLERPKNESMTVYQSSVLFKGSATNAVELTINGLKIPLGRSGEFEHRVELNSKNGNNI